MISILLATYNGERFLAEQLKSILAQTNSDWHLWIEDDGSTDNTLNIISEFAATNAEKITFISTEQSRLGVTRRFESLLEAVESEYYMFADQDDVWLPNKIDSVFELMSKAEENPSQPIIICTDLQVVDEQLEMISPSYRQYARLRPDLLENLEQLAINNYVTGCTMLFNDAAKQVSLPFGRFAQYHDAWIALKTLLKGGKIIYSTKADILYRQHTGNKVGAVRNVKSAKYILSKLLHAPQILSAQHNNFKQAHEAMGISRIRFIKERIKYLMKR